MSKRNLIKVCVFRGSCITDYYNYLKPLMKKSPSRVIFHAVTKDSDCILNDLLELKSYLTKQFPECEFIISCPTIRTDNHAANITIRNLCCKLKDLKIPIIYHENVDTECLGRGGLHLNEKGFGRLAMNFISYNRTH